MFNDFHESTRNVGMVGVLLGFLVLVGFCGLGMAVFSGLNASDDGPTMAVRIIRQEGIMEDLNDEVRKKTSTLQKLEGFRSAAKSMEENQEALSKLEKIVALHQEKISGLQDTIEAEGVSFEEYRDQYRQRERSLAEGEVIDLSETKGEGFEACKILGISPLYLRVMRSAGPIGIPYQELPLSVQDRFQFGAEEAEVYQQKVNAMEAKRDEQIAAFRKKQKAMKAGEALADLKRRIKETALGIQTNDNLARKLVADAKAWDRKAEAYDRQAEAARSAGRITSSPGLARKARGEATKLRRQANDAEAKARELEADLIGFENLLLEAE